MSFSSQQQHTWHLTSLREVEACFARAGFRLVRDFARSPFIHTLHLALFERIEV